MDDLTITRLCAEAMGYRQDRDGGFSKFVQGAGMDEPQWMEFIYAPLHDDAQAMALVKRFNLSIAWQPNMEMWWIQTLPPEESEAYNADLNRAICECVAKLKQGES